MSPDQPSPAFIDWWFAPWRNGGPALAEPCVSELAQRDAYGHWCRQAGVPAHLPSHADWQWQGAAAVNAEMLLQAAELFGGLLAARRQRHEELAQLLPQRRRWCLAVALTQPLTDWSDASVRHATPYQRGLLEFALRAERGLPGLWSRLALLLPEPVRPRLQPQPGPGRSLHQRDCRCWLMCVAQAQQINHDNS